MNSEYIEISGARTHNLKNISLEIPKNKLVVVTGKSGSGKSTLIIDTLFNYAKKHYLDALSSRNYGSEGGLEYDVNYIKNIQPPVAIEQRRKLYNNPRSTIGTLTTIDGYLRILFSVAGTPVCSVCFNKTDSERYCDDCGCYAEEIIPQNFSPTAKEGMCLNCNGVGSIIEFTEDKLIPDKSITLEKLWNTAKKNTFNIPSNRNVFEKLMEHYNITWDTKYEDLSDDFKYKLLYGSDEVFEIRLKKVTNQVNHLGIITYLDNQYKKTVSIDRRNDLEVYLDNSTCDECNGGKLRKDSLMVTVGDKTYYEVQNMSFTELYEYIDNLSLPANKYNPLKDILSDLKIKCQNIIDLSVGYLCINRQISTLSGGELQRILISQHLSSDLTGVLYILDEPTVGLHDSDSKKIIDMLKKLRDMGNSVIVIEHDEHLINEADYVIEIGPGAGKYGGEIIAYGNKEQLLDSENSLSKKYMKNRKRLRSFNKLDTSVIKFEHLKTNNLKDIEVTIPVQRLVTVTGVSGSGKSSMIKNIYKIVSSTIRNGMDITGKLKTSIDKHIDEIIYINQNPIKGSSRSNLMTYIGFYDDIRNIFFIESQSMNLDYTKSHFSINVPGGRCEHCNGHGEIEIDMYFLKNELVICEECGGKRFRKEILEVKYNGYTISDIFELSIEDAYSIFKENKNVCKALKYLMDFGLGYLKLGQTTDSLSGGEAQRIHLITELLKSKNRNTLFIFDEPSTGLHYSDIEYLIKLFNELINKGNTVIVIEHNMDIIYNSDYVIDLGPEAGKNGGEVVYHGTIDGFLSYTKGYTAKCLREHIDEYYSK